MQQAFRGCVKLIKHVNNTYSVRAQVVHLMTGFTQGFEVVCMHDIRVRGASDYMAEPNKKKKHARKRGAKGTSSTNVGEKA